MIKRVIVVSACSILLALGVYAGVSFSGSLQPSLKLPLEFSTFDNLLEKSPIIITGTVVSDNNEVKYKEMTFAITKVKVNESIRGNEKGETIDVLQTKSQEDPYLVKGNKVLLFLSEYEGPVAENVHVINGLYNGQFKIKGDTVYGVGKEKKHSFSSSKQDEVIAEIRNAKFKPELERKKPSAIDIENENILERQLEKRLDNK